MSARARVLARPSACQLLSLVKLASRLTRFRERNLKRMKSNSFVRCLALLAAIALAAPAFAKPFTKTITISQTAKLGKAELTAGEYRLQIEGNKATVQKGKQVVAESDGRWEDRSAKSDYNSVVISEKGQVLEVRFAGQARVFVFSE